MIVTRPLLISPVPANVSTAVLAIAFTLTFAQSLALVVVDPAGIVTSVVPNFVVSVI